MKLFYQMAHETKGEVDHIVPISHPLVCGLHTEDNMQVVHMHYNNFKSNYFWPDMPEYSYKDWQDAYFSNRN